MSRSVEPQSNPHGQGEAKHCHDGAGSEHDYRGHARELPAQLNGRLVSWCLPPRGAGATEYRVAASAGRGYGSDMRYVCEAGERTWFQIETEAEAAAESKLMNHAVEKHFREAKAEAATSYVPPDGPVFEQNIGLAAHVSRVMPTFLTLRDAEGNGLATAMIPRRGLAPPRPIVVGRGNTDPYPEHGDAIRRLGEHLGLTLDRGRCFPYAGRQQSISRR